MLARGRGGGLLVLRAFQLTDYLPVTRLASPDRGGTLSGFVPRGDAVHRGSRPRGLLGTRGRTGLASRVGPVLVGVIFAFAWNMATSHRPQVPQPGPGLVPTVGPAVDQAADQACASATPIATYLPYRSTAAPAASPGSASTVCRWAKSSRVVRTVPMVTPPTRPPVPRCGDFLSRGRRLQRHLLRLQHGRRTAGLVTPAGRS